MASHCWKGDRSGASHELSRHEEWKPPNDLVVSARNVILEIHSGLSQLWALYFWPATKSDHITGPKLWYISASVSAKQWFREYCPFARQCIREARDIRERRRRCRAGKMEKIQQDGTFLFFLYLQNQWTAIMHPSKVSGGSSASNHSVLVPPCCGALWLPFCWNCFDKAISRMGRIHYLWLDEGWNGPFLCIVGIESQQKMRRTLSCWPRCSTR